MRQGLIPPPSTSRPSTLPPLPPSAPLPHTTAPRIFEASQATISAEPELRDLKRESTAFVPTTVKRRKTAATVSRVNAAPASQEDGQDVDGPTLGPQVPDLMTTLRNASVGGVAGAGKPAPKAKDDYENFLEGIGDILGNK